MLGKGLISQTYRKIVRLVSIGERSTKDRETLEHKRKFTIGMANFQVLKDSTDKSKLVLTIERKPITEWFKGQFDKLCQTVHRPIQPQRKRRGIKL